MIMWPQTDVYRVVSNAKAVLDVMAYTRSPLE